MSKRGEWLGRVRGRSLRQVKVNYHASSSGFVAWWVGLLILHFINLGYYVGVALLYDSFQLTFTYSAIHLLAIGIDNSQYPTVSILHATIAAVHAFFIVLMVVSSIYERKLVFQPNYGKIFRAVVKNPSVSWVLSHLITPVSRLCFNSARSSAVAVSTSERGSSSRTLSRVSDSFLNTGALIFARDGLLGVDSVYFDHVLLLRELVETALQSYQVYRMSQLLPRLWLIRFYVVLLVANCWAMPFLHRYYRHRETTRRMLCLLCDAVLDMVSSIGISLIIFGTYVPQYNDPNGFGFPFPNWFNDHWLANMQQEFQMMLVASWGDMISRLVFALGLLQCMDAIKEMLTPVAGLTPTTIAVKQDKSAVASSRASSHAQEATPRSSTGGTDGKLKKKNASIKEAVKTRLQRLVHFVVHVVGPGIFVLWGFAFLAVHFVAETHYSDATCEQRLKPWLSSKPGCSIIEINCHDIQSSGHDESIAEALDIFDPERAARVVFRHCPALVLTPKIQEFKNMAGLKIYNSTVVSWDEAAAITGTHHELIRSLFFVRTFFPNGELPHGLLTNDFPPLLADFVTCVTNIRLLPDDLDTKWSSGLQIALEFSQMIAVPDVLIRLKPKLVSFAGCAITSVPAKLFDLQKLDAVLLGMTHVQELPRDVTRVSPTLRVFFFQHTNVTTIWSWMDRFIDFQMLFPTKLFSAYGTPYCRELLEIVAGNRREFSATREADFAKIMDVSTPEKLAYAQRAIECKPTFITHFPLPAEDAMHGLH